MGDSSQGDTSDSNQQELLRQQVEEQRRQDEERRQEEERRRRDNQQGHLSGLSNMLNPHNTCFVSPALFLLREGEVSDALMCMGTGHSVGSLVCCVWVLGSLVCCVWALGSLVCCV